MKQYVVDAFTDEIFHGNQAAVCILEQWLPDELMMSITRENNFSETAFAVKEGEKFHLRWFTPGGEIDLCGHATLACAYILFRFYFQSEDQIVFSTLSGDLTVSKRDDMLEMEFPAYKLERVSVTNAMICGSGHCHIAPYWAEKLGKKNIVAYQASRRGGTLYCRVSEDRVFLAGKAALFSECELYI